MGDLDRELERAVGDDRALAGDAGAAGADVARRGRHVAVRQAQRRGKGERSAREGAALAQPDAVREPEDDLVPGRDGDPSPQRMHAPGRLEQQVAEVADGELLRLLPEREHDVGVTEPDDAAGEARPDVKACGLALEDLGSGGRHFHPISAARTDALSDRYGPEMRVIQLLRSPSRARIVAPETTVVPPRPTILSVRARPDGPREATRRRRKRPRV